MKLFLIIREVKKKQIHNRALTNRKNRGESG